MAIEQAPPQHDGRVARGRRRDIQTFLWLCGWGGATALALIVFAVASQTKTATERLRQIFALNEPSAVAELPPRIAQLEPIGFHRNRLTAQQPDDRLEAFIHAPALIHRVDTHHEGVADQRAGSHAEHGAAPGHVIELRYPIGDHQRMMVRE